MPEATTASSPHTLSCDDGEDGDLKSLGTRVDAVAVPIAGQVYA